MIKQTALRGKDSFIEKRKIFPHRLGKNIRKELSAYIEYVYIPYIPRTHHMAHIWHISDVG